MKSYSEYIKSYIGENLRIYAAYDSFYLELAYILLDNYNDEMKYRICYYFADLTSLLFLLFRLALEKKHITS